MLDGQKILITGGNGLIGRALIAELLEKGARLRVQVRNARLARAIFHGDIDFHKIEIVECDFTKFTDAACADLIIGCSVVVHLAGLVHHANASYEDYELLNVRTTDQLAHAAQVYGIETFLLFSTSAVYGEGPFSMLDETAPIEGTTPYAVSKSLCEQIMRKNLAIKRIINLRPALVFGEGDRGNLIKLIQSINKGHYIQIGKGDTTKSLIYAKDLATAVILCLQKLPVGQHTLNVANPQTVSLKELSTEILQALGKNGFIPEIPASLMKATTMFGDKFIPGVLPVSTAQLDKLTRSTTLSVNKLVQSTGFQPSYALANALKREINWARENGLL